MHDLDIQKERGRGYNALYFLINAAYILNSISLMILLWTLGQGQALFTWQGHFAIAQSMLYGSSLNCMGSDFSSY